MKASTPQHPPNMSSRPLAKHDIPLLSSVREYRVLSIRQLAAISRRSCQVVRRRIRSLEDSGLIIKKPFGYGRNQGRPEEIVYLSLEGMKLLSDKSTNSIPADIKSHTIDHELLLNWFRIHWLHMEKVIPLLSFTYLSPREHSSETNQLFRLHIPSGLGNGNANAIIPDGIFAINHSEHGKALLFFLEVDMDSEAMSGKRGNTNTIHHKILCYQELYRNKHYKRLEEAFGSKFNGFRLLFLASTDARVAALCRFAKTTQSSDFIWLTDQSRMFDHGLSANIWVRGGRYEDPRESILGPGLASESPIMASIR
ncbi:MAG: replication-relaxation family protein [Methanothrix sp.]|nr:replication-relaxation family protein [Methanothrix sp.]